MTTSQAAGTKLSVNVLDYGALPDGATDCSAAFQRAIDDLDPKLGGTVLIPAASSWYQFDRSVVVDRDNIRFVGENPTTTVLETRAAIPPLIFGLQRGKRTRPLSAAHWEDLSGILDTTAAPAAGDRWGYRTKVPLLVPPVPGGPDADIATVTFPCSPFALGPVDNESGWQGLRQFTLDFAVRNNGGWSTQSPQQLFGLVDLQGRPTPFAVWAQPTYPGVELVFAFSTADGLQREIHLTLDADEPMLRCSLQLDFETGAVAAWLNRVQVTPDLSLINDRWLPADRVAGAQPAFGPNWYSPFNLGALNATSSGWGGSGWLPGGEVDLTFAALRLSGVCQYTDLGEGRPQQTAGGPVADLDWVTNEAGVFACLPMNEPAHNDAAGVPDLQVPWTGGRAGHYGYGLVLSVDLNPTDTVGGNTVEKLTVNCGRVFGSGYGQGIAVGQVYGLRLNDVVVQFGAQGLSSYNIGVSYPVELRSCQFSWQTDAGIYAYGQINRGENVAIAYYGRSAFKALRSDLSYRNVFCTDSVGCESAVRLYDSSGRFDGWTFDFENAASPFPSDSVFWACLGSDIGGPTLLAIRDCQSGTAGPGAVAVRLVSSDRNGGLGSSARGPGWCTIERSFDQYAFAGMAGIVGVDGPLWQGTYAGPPPRVRSWC